MIFQIFLIAFAVIAIVRTWRQYHREHISAHWMQVWFSLWLIVILVAISPITTDKLAQFVGVGRGADLLVYVAILFLLYGVSRIIATQEKQRKELTDLVRKIAIENVAIKEGDEE